MSRMCVGLARACLACVGLACVGAGMCTVQYGAIEIGFWRVGRSFLKPGVKSGRVGSSFLKNRNPLHHEKFRFAAGGGARPER